MGPSGGFEARRQQGTRRKRAVAHARRVTLLAVMHRKRGDGTFHTRLLVQLC